MVILSDIPTFTSNPFLAIDKIITIKVIDESSKGAYIVINDMYSGDLTNLDRAVKIAKEIVAKQVEI